MSHARAPLVAALLALFAAVAPAAERGPTEVREPGTPPAHAAAPRGGPYTPSPTDWRDLSIYQVLTDRFFNGDLGNDGVEGNFDPTDGARNHGGDWAGIEQKLDYIEGLGATALWISPVQTNAYAAYHGYHIQDFYSFAAQHGGITALRSLVDEAHARGMFVILDVIANHGGDLIDSGDGGYPGYQNPGTYALRWRNPGNPAAPPFDDLADYHAHGQVGVWTDPEQILGEIFGLDDFRTEDPAVRADLIAAHEWLVEQTDADGFRIDTVKHVELSFWQDFGPALRGYASTLGKNDFLMFGEVFDGDPVKNGLYTGTVAGGAYALDSVLWYPMYFTAGTVFRDDNPTEWLSFTLADSVHYEPGTTARNVTFLDNHDNARFMGFGSSAHRDDAKARSALTFSHTSVGIPLVYYGMEQEFDGGGDPWNREDMWDGAWDFGPSEGDNFDQTAPLYRHVRRLNELRWALPALRRGTQEDVTSTGGAGIYAFYRKLPGEATALVVINTADGSRSVTFDPDLPAGTMTDGLSGRTVSVPATGTIVLEMPGRTASVFTSAPVPSEPWVEDTWPPHDGSLRSTNAEVRIAWDRAMNPGSVESELTVTPAAVFTPHWIGNTLALRPTSGWSPGTRYRVVVDRLAVDAAGDPIGADFAFEFETTSPVAGLTVPAGYTANPLPSDDLQEPLCLEPGTGLDHARLWLGDTGWDRLFDVRNRGWVEAVVVDDVVGRPNSVAADRVGGAFAGDVLIADSQNLLRVRRDGFSAGDVSVLNSLPGSALDWVVAVDPDGAFAGAAFVGRPGSGTLHRVDAFGNRTAFVTGLGGVAGLAFGAGGDLGTDLYVLRTSGTITRVTPAAVTSTLASAPALSGARSLAADPAGAFDGDLFATHDGSGSILRIDPVGNVSTFALGFTDFPGADALAFDRHGDLAVVENDGSTRRVVKIVPDSSDAIATEIPVPVVGIGITRVGPNPFRSSTRIDFVLPDDGVGAVSAELTIHDVAGRRVAAPWSAAALPGSHTLTWDGRTDDGAAVPPGVYFARLRAGAREWSQKLVRR